MITKAKAKTQSAEMERIDRHLERPRYLRKLHFGVIERHYDPSLDWSGPDRLYPRMNSMSACCCTLFLLSGLEFTDKGQRFRVYSMLESMCDASVIF